MSTTSGTHENVIARFVNLGGALVELHTVRFLTKWKPEGPPWNAVRPYEIDGWNWRCTGCREFGREGETYDDPAFRDLPDAREGAQEHAEMCRAVPKTATPEGWEYLVESYRDKHTTFEDILGRYCRSEWELVTVDWDGRRVIFKRPAGGAA